MANKHKQLLFIELNEVNFEYLEHFAQRGALPNFARFLGRHGYAETTSEQQYDHLEPWIQWVTAHTGKSFSEHQVFRLGDIVDADIEQIWEELERDGLKVGAISPMNAKNRLKNPAFFVPDPWTSTDIVAAPVVRRLYEAVTQAVNDNSQSRIAARSLMNLAIGGALTASPRNYAKYLQYVSKARGRPWFKAIFLDQLLSDLFIKSVKKHETHFATLFLNAAAHIQHHYMFSSAAYQGEMRNPEWYVGKSEDPLLDVYAAYDQILGRVVEEFPSTRIMIATGLHQVPHATVTYYWRIRDHANYLRKIGVPFISVEPRMSRDFLVTCASSDEASRAAAVLESAFDDEGEGLFEVDNRGDSLFVTLTYASDITDQTIYSIDQRRFADLKGDVAFVAIKNGEHSGVGYFSDSEGEALRGRSFALTEIPLMVKANFGGAASLVA